MADKEVLSQEEIDALLESVESDEVESERQEDSPVSSTDGGDDVLQTTSEPEFSTSTETLKNQKPSQDDVSLVNFTNQERNVRGELPVLEKIYDRAARFFSQDIYQLMAKDLEMSQEPLAVYRHREFMGALPNPSLMTIFQFKPLRGKALIYFDSTFVYDLVDFYFGGSSHFSADKDKTDFTATENRVMDIVIAKLMRNMEQAWLPILPLQVIKMGDETNPQLVHISEPNEVILVTRFKVEFGKEIGQFAFVIPYTMVEPIKQQLELGAARPDDELDPNWVNSLKEELMDVELEISAYMAETVTTLGEVISWREGDYIPMQQRETVTLDIEGTPSFEVTMGSAGEKLALQILKQIKY